MNRGDKPYLVIGIVDAYGAIHHQLIPFGKSGELTHDHYWPTQTHKRWRFNLYEWTLDNSMLSKDKLTAEEAEDVIAFLRKRYQPPYWLIEGEEWDAIGRARSGPAYEKHRRKWDRFWAKQNKKRSA
jgi:hypothetical protein